VTDRHLRLAMGGAATAGLAVAGYLTWVHYAHAQPICLAGGGGCAVVQASEWATFAGVPVALIGLIGYALILGSLLIAGEAGRVLGALLALGGFGFSAYLTWIELFELGAICQWCVASAAIMTVLAVLASVRLVRGAPPRAAGAES
jgi:uncharacterized membrane protein